MNAQQIETCLRRLGLYRVRRAQTVANEGAPDGISGATLLALGLRESGLRNINGGLKRDPNDPNKWIADPKKPDKGIFQISSLHHTTLLKWMIAVEEDSWWPVIEGRTAYDFGYSPRFEESLRFTLANMHEAQAYAADHDVPEDELGRFAVAAHNAGAGGALKGWREGDIDRYTALGDYSAWVARHATKVRHWLNLNPKYKP